MITLNDAIVKANEYVEGIQLTSQLELALLLEDTIEFELGWVFFYQSKEYIQTGDFLDAIAGNAPIIVNKYDGSLHVTGTAHTVEWYIAKYVEEIKNK